ncbi:MAG: hypothetical protein K6F56_09480 [Oscillospiraceae bacterium]|nr:hypothetical protein [Oscillospiraceae bacterium]
MLECYVSGQSLKLYTPVIAADSLHYLTGLVHFSGSDWDGHSAWLHFRRGETVYDVALDESGAFGEEAELTLTAGEWELYLTGSDGEDRLTTVPLQLTVKASGLVDAPLHPMPLSVAEQIDSKATNALAFAAAVKAAAEAGDFDGEDGKSFVIGGFYDTYAELTAAVSDPAPGEAYGVGTTIPYDIYIWDEINLTWKNNGPIQGARGETGAAGATFTPSVDTNGNLSWTNNGGLENPVTRNIKGPTGATGPAGADGQSPYSAAVENGYTGTEATFNAALAAVPYHNARHLPEGADPITVQTGNLANGAVTLEKMAAAAKAAFVAYDTDQSGNTSAAQKAQGRKNIDAASKAYLLWQNASPGSSFAAQNISVDPRGYACIDVFFCQWIDSGGKVDGYVRVPVPASGTQYFSLGAVANANTVRHWCSLSASSARIHFDDCTIYPTYCNQTGRTNNEMCVPVRVYGIK